MGDRPEPRPARGPGGRFVKTDPDAKDFTEFKDLFRADSPEARVAEIDRGRVDPLAELAAEMTGEIAGLRAYIEAREAERRPVKPDNADSLAVWYRAVAVMVVAALVVAGVVATAYLLRTGG